LSFIFWGFIRGFSSPLIDVYMTEVWRDIFKNVSSKEAGRKSFRLPVIVPIVLYNGQAQWTVPLHFKETLNSPELFLDQVVDFQYILINVNSYQEEELLQLSNLLGAVFLVDQAKSIAEIIERLKKLSGVIKKMEPEEFRLFISWTENILTRGISSVKKEEIAGIMKKSHPEEVETMISNVERVIKKSLKDAEKQGEKQGIEKGMRRGIERGIIKVAKQMLAAGEDIEKIMRYTGLSREEIEEIKNKG